MEYFKCKSGSCLTGDAWMRDQEVRLKALMQVPEAERARALKDFVGGDQNLYKQMYGGVVTTKDAPQPNIFDSISQWLAEGSRPCL